MVGVIDGFRWALIGAAPPDPFATGVSIVVAIVMLVGGAYYFRRMEKTFADVT
jgi:lipopolysaccharide transport system permease protein